MAMAVEIMPRNRIPPMMPGVIIPIPCVESSQRLTGTVSGSPPNSMMAEACSISVLNETFRTRTEYSAQVMAAPSSDRFPMNRDEES